MRAPRLAALGALVATSVPAQHDELHSFEPLLFCGLADPKDPGLDLFREQLRLRAWLARGDHRRRVIDNPLAVHAFNRLSPDQGGPLGDAVRWYPHAIGTNAAGTAWSHAPLARSDTPAVCLFDPAVLDVPPKGKGAEVVELVPLDIGAPHFTQNDVDVGRLAIRRGQTGLEVLYAMLPERAEAYRAWTAARVEQRVAYAVAGRLVMAPTIVAPIARRGLITGNFDGKWLEDAVAAMRAAVARRDATGSPQPPGADAEPRPTEAAESDELRAIVRAQRTLRAQSQAARRAGERVVTFERLAGAEPGALGAAPITMFGMALPLDRVAGMREFLLIPSFWECAFTNPPPRERVVRVVVHRALDYADLRGRALRVEGALSASEDPHGAGFRLAARAVRAID